MRTAVVRVNVDPGGGLSAAQLDAGLATLRRLASKGGGQLVEHDLAATPATRREVELLMAGTDPDKLMAEAIAQCAKAFGTTPAAGVVTYISRGTDDDAHGVLMGFGLVGDIRRIAGDDGWDVVYVTLRKSALERVPESRIHTALEAALNCEVRIETR
jgi:hypothetical protein